MARLLITGGAGFIGTHTCLTLLESDHKLVILDNFSNSSPIALERVKKLARISKQSNHNFLLKEGDVRDKKLLEDIFEEFILKKEPIEGVIHLAGLKSVAESLKDPISYWDVNVNGTFNLIKVMEKYNCKILVFSSSATIYGSQDNIPISENAPINPLNPYGNTKAVIEKLLSDIAGCKDNKTIQEDSNKGWKIARLRYFNPVGAHPSGSIGEDPRGIPNNLFPYINKVAFGKIKFLKIYGNNWDTKDGTGVRDYIHIMDLARGHCASLEHLLVSKPQLLTLNLGTGKGNSVLQVLKNYEKILKKKIPFKIVGRRFGDSAITIADVSMAKKIINWEAKKNIEDMCIDSIKWQSNNPEGYK